MKKNSFILIFMMLSLSSFSQTSIVKVNNGVNGMTLKVDGKNFMVNGMNWDYFPIGTNYTYNLWSQPDDFVKSALDGEMGLLKKMGVNAIRQYVGIQPKWIEYIFKNYGIYTMLNHPFGRYGVNLNDSWEPITDYSNPAVRNQLLLEVTKLAEEYKCTPGLLLYLLGNENNYGLFWAGAETEDFPEEEEKGFIGEERGRPMYKLINEATLKMKAIDTSHPVAICNGDVQFIDIIAEECKDIDIYGVNMYRGASFTDAFQVVKEKLNKPILFTEFGSDAYNAKENKEDQKMQAYYNVANWKEIYENAAGLGKAENSIGGFTFQFSDGWWKYGQTKNLDIHDTHASWTNGGYNMDSAVGQNNMNEEWFGICAKGRTNDRGHYKLYPRAAYYALKEVHQLNPYESGTTLETIDNYFDNVEIMDAVLKAREETMKKLNLHNSKLIQYLTFSGIGWLLVNCSNDETQTVTNFDQIVMQDEFDTDGAPNSNIWNYDIGTGKNGWGNNELQYYTDRPENIIVENGMLKITARQESYMGSGYTSARLLTKCKFEKKYGRFEAKIQLPLGQGIWPAFWLLGDKSNAQVWPKIGEIDIMEYRGQNPTQVLGTVHGPGYSAGESISKNYNLTNHRFDTGFHIFGIEWGPDYINFYVDDVLYNQITPEDVPGDWVFDHPFYIIMNVAVGGSFVGAPNAQTVFPQTMLVDYVRVYEFEK